MSKQRTDAAAGEHASATLSRRHAVAALAAIPLLTEAAAAEESVARLIELSNASNAALMRGDIDTYRARLTISNDFTLMSPFGGKPSHASEYTSETWERMGRFFRNGTFEQEVVQSYASADMVVLALFERTRVEVGGLPAQDWALRVTLVYRRDGSEWHLVHRHADPLANGISLQQAAALARGSGRAG